MPELSRFFGIIIRMYLEAGGQHRTPHFHAYYQEKVAVFGIDYRVVSCLFLLNHCVKFAKLGYATSDLQNN